jgi:hypothetical protein
MKNPTLQDVRDRRTQISKATAELAAEDAELATAEKVLIRLGASTEPAAVLPPLPPAPLAAPPWAAAAPAPPAAPTQPAEEEGVVESVKKRMTGNETLERLIVMLFEDCSDDWWTANEVQSHLTLIKGKDVPMASISPTLTNMKNNGLIVRDGLNVGLATRHKQTETATE